MDWLTKSSVFIRVHPRFQPAFLGVLASRRLGVKTAALFIFTALFTLTACQSPPRSSRIAVEDYQAMSAEMSQSLRQSDAINDRSSASEPWVISFDKVTNLSSEIMPQGEQWGIIAMIRGAQPIRELWDEKRIAFVIPAQYAIDQRDTLDAQRADKGFGTERGVTHTLTATFRSVTRSQVDRRVDLYACQFELIDLRDGTPVWIDEFTFQRQAKGDVRD